MMSGEQMEKWLADANQRIAQLEAQRQEDADLIAAQKREIEVLHGIREEVERLRVVIDRLEKDYKPAFVDAERWRETMLEWGDGVVNGFGDFWNRISAQMTREEQQAAIDAAKNCD